MSALKIAVAAAVLALAASPALAFTVTPPANGGQPQARMANSENMLDGAGAPFQDAAVRNSTLNAPGGAPFTSGGYYGANSNTSTFNFGGVQGTTTVNSYPGWSNYSNTSGYLPYSSAPPPFYYARRH